MAGIELTSDDIKNGWTKDKLEAYHAERERESAKAIFPKPQPKRVANSTYSPHRWRR